MFGNYLKIAWRNVSGAKGYSLINIAGLAAGMAIAMLVGVWVFDELSFNKSFRNYDRLAQVYHHVTFGEEILTINDVPAPIGEELKNNFGEFEDVAVATWPAQHIIRYGDKKLSENAISVEPAFADMFSLKMLRGTSSALKEVHTVLLSRTLAEKLIGDNPLGKVVKTENGDILTVAGVFEDFPKNSAFADIKMLLTMAGYAAASAENREQMSSWDAYSFQCFVLLRENTTFREVESKIKDVLYKRGKAMKPRGLLLPMAQWHLYADFKDGVNTGGQIRFVRMFSIIGIFVLVLACINFMNLSTARSEKRSREVGVRKVMGSARAQLVMQFLSESLLVVLMSFMLALCIVYFALPWFNDLAEKKMVIPWTEAYFIICSLAAVLLTSLFAGFYPAFYLSSFNPAKVLKGTFRTGRFVALPRKVLVVFQFSTSIVLMIGTVIVLLQIRHAKARAPGFDRQGIFHIAIRTERLANADYNTLRHALLATGVVENMAKSDFPVTGSMSADATLTWQGKDPAVQPLVAMNSCSHDFPKTNGFQFVEGRDFSRAFTTDSSAVIVNEMAARLFGDENVLGKKIKFGHGKEREIIGIIKDQVRWGPFAKQSPHIYYINYEGMGYLTIRLNRGANVHQALGKLEQVIGTFDEEAPFDYKFQHDDYARQFSEEERIGRLATVFSVLAIFISCIGILGLAAFAASRRSREISIRKVMGASVFNLWRMLSNDFMLLVLVSILVAFPLGYFLADRWLQQYEYRVAIPWLVFVATGVVALAITLATVSYQTLKAALANPVESLRSE